MSVSPAVEELIDQYCSAWSDPDPVRRRALFEGIDIAEVGSAGIRGILGFFGDLAAV